MDSRRQVVSHRPGVPTARWRASGFFAVTTAVVIAGFRFLGGRLGRWWTVVTMRAMATYPRSNGLSDFGLFDQGHCHSEPGFAPATVCTQVSHHSTDSRARSIIDAWFQCWRRMMPIQPVSMKAARSCACAHALVGGDQRRLRMRAIRHRLDQRNVLRPLARQIERMQHFGRIGRADIERQCELADGTRHGGRHVLVEDDPHAAA